MSALFDPNSPDQTTPDPDGLSPFQRALLNGQPYRPGMFGQGWSGNGNAGQVPVNNLGGANILPLGQGAAAGIQNPPGGNTASYRGFAMAQPTPPAAPNTAPLFDQLGQAGQQHALATVNPYQVQANQEWGAGTGLGAHLNAMPTVDPSAAQFHPQAYNPQAVPQYDLPGVPQRVAVRQDPMSLGLAGLASIFAPKVAGQIMASPLEAAVNVSKMKTDNQIRQYQEAMQQAAMQHEVAAGNVNQANAAQLHNVTGQNAANVALGNLQYANQEQRAGLTGQQAAANATAAGLEPLGASQTNANEAAARLSQIDQELQSAGKMYGLDIERYRGEMMPWGRMMYGAINNAGRDAQTDAKDQSLQTIGAGHDAARVQVGAANNATSAANNAATNATKKAISDANIQADASGPTGAAAKDPATQNAYNLYRGFASDLSKTERILQQGWKTAGGANVNDQAAFAQWLHSNPVWQRQADVANKAFQDYQNKAKAATTPTPGTAGVSAPPAAHATPPGKPSPSPAAPARPTGYTFDPATGKMIPNR